MLVSNKYFDKLLKIHGGTGIRNKINTPLNNTIRYENEPSNKLPDTYFNITSQKGGFSFIRKLPNNPEQQSEPSEENKTADLKETKKPDTYIDQALGRAQELFKNILTSNNFGKKLSNSFKDAFNGFVERTNTVKMTYAPIKNGIDLTYGGGFLVFDSTFNFKNVMHVYLDGKSSVMQIKPTSITDINQIIGKELLNNGGVGGSSTPFTIKEFINELEKNINT